MKPCPADTLEIERSWAGSVQGLLNGTSRGEDEENMGVKGWNVAVLVAIGAIWFCGTTQREKPVVGDASNAPKVSALESKAASSPNDAAALRELAQGYLDIRQPGMAVGTIERAPAALRGDATVEHLYARALLEQGRSADALAAEKRVLASATRRAEIVEQLVQLGIEDANAQPEASSLAYHNATRQVSLSVTAR